MLQPRIVTTTYLGSVPIVDNLYSCPSGPTCLNRFWIFLDSLLLLPPPHQQPFVVVTPLHSTRSPPPLLVQNAVHLDVAHTRHPPPASLRRSSLRRMPASAAISRVRSLPPPFPPSPCTQVPVSPGSSVVGSSVSLVSLPLPPCVFLQLLASYGAWFLYRVSIFARGQEARAPPLPVSCLSRSSPPATWPCRRLSSSPAPPPPPHLFPPPCRLDPIPPVEIRGA